MVSTAQHSTAQHTQHSTQNRTESFSISGETFSIDVDSEAVHLHPWLIDAALHRPACSAAHLGDVRAKL
jgi:hypothetical protein